ncbi:hypothetical protein [Mycobacterium avium]|uniref:hypothetical protein n=1 Tax=Mycobacterium avium TaxID=1764 RepID=UPI001CC41413|nr:hypothetical protein [Mycobacterium avium]MBZ4622127.1 hypothetical protein [Mycobacterium avium subsp. hominissuis]
MTLLLNMSKAEGLYLSADYRGVNSATEEFIDDERVKFLTVHYPGGTKAMIAFTGIAILKDGTPVGTWLRETLRGRTEAFDVSMAHLHARLKRDFERYRQHLIVTVIVMGGDGRRGFGGFTNQKASGYISRDFGYRMDELSGPQAFAGGAPAAQAEDNGQFELIKQQLLVRPRHPRDHMNMLAAINRRVAEADQRRAIATDVDGAIGTVSPFCHVAFIPATNEYEPESRVYTNPDEVNPPFAMPLLFHGIDTEYGFKMVLEMSQNGGAFNHDPEEAQRLTDRRP